MARQRANWSSWPAMGAGQLLLIAGAGALAVGAIAHVAVVGFTQPRLALAFGALIAFGEIARISMPGNRQAAPLAAAGALGYVLVLRTGETTLTMHSASQAIGVTAVGMAVGALPHVAVGHAARLDALAGRVLSVGVVAFGYRPLCPALSSAPHWWGALAAMMATVGAASLIDTLVGTVIRVEALRTRFGVTLRDELRSQLPLDAAASATAIVLAFSTQAMGAIALLVFCLPLLVTQVAFRRFAGIRATYLQTVRSLSRVTEVGGYVEDGHSRRVSRLAVAIGRELGMNESALLELEYAALMHDIGQLSLPEPIPGGATVLAKADEQARIAELGSEVIRQTGLNDDVVQAVRRQWEPYRGHEPGAAPPPMASRVIRAANAYDDLVGPSTDRDRVVAALERLRMDVTEYDPSVVEALSRVVDRGARLG